MDVIVGGELFITTPDHRKSWYAKPKTQLQAPDATSFFPVGGMLIVQLTWKTSSGKVRMLWHCSRLRSVALYLVIDRGDIRQAIDRCSNIWVIVRRWLWSVRVQGWQPGLQNSKKRAERSERLMRGAESLRLSPLWLSASSSACHGLLIITVITPLPQSPATKCQRTEAGDPQLLTCRCVMRMLVPDAKYTKELADAKAENDGFQWWCCRWSSSVAHQSSLLVSAQATTPPAWIMQPPLTGRHRWTGLFHPQSEADHYKNNRKEPILMSSADRVAHIDGTYAWQGSNIMAQRSINA